MLPTKFKVSWPFGSGEEAKKKKFQDGHHGGHLEVPIGMILAIFYLKVTPDASYQVSSQLAFWFRRRSEKCIFQMAALVAILDF